MNRSQRDWRKIAAAGSALLEGPLADLPRIEAHRRAAAQLHVSEPSLRSYIQAQRFEATLDGELKAAAAKLPGMALAAAARWSDHGGPGLAEAMGKLASGAMKFADFGKAERDARPPGISETAGRGARRYPEALAQRFDMLAPRHPVPVEDQMDLRRFVPIARKNWPDDPVGKADLFAHHFKQQRHTIAIMIAGPYGDTKAYRDRAADWCLRVLGLARIHGRAALILPKAAEAAPYAAILADAEKPNDRTVALFQDPLDPGAQPPPPGYSRINRD